ncbi:MAG: ATP synthase F0 subunit B [Gammaproteobacteria bacterium]
MSPAVANFLFEAVNFLLLAAALGWILFKPVRAALDRERQRQVTHDEEQVRLRAEAESLREEARAARENAEHESAARHDEVLAAARQEAARIVAEARRSEAEERRTFETELAHRHAGEAAALAEAVARIAGESVHRLLATLAGPDLDNALVQAACAELEPLSESDRATALVESARPLGAASRDVLEHALGGAFEHRVVGELGAGVRVTTAAGQIDATAVSIARQAAATLTVEGAAAGALQSAKSDD